MVKKAQHERPLAQNRKASHDYYILDTIEAGIALTGTEIKSVRAGRLNLKDGFAQIKNGEAWLMSIFRNILKEIDSIMIRCVIVNCFYIENRSLN